MIKCKTQQHIEELQTELNTTKMLNRRLLRDITDLKIEVARLQMMNNRLEAELSKWKGDSEA